jgi:hypothetical protein
MNRISGVVLQVFRRLGDINNAMRKWFTQQRGDSVAAGSPFLMTKRERKWKDSCKMLAVWTEVASQHF